MSDNRLVVEAQPRTVTGKKVKRLRREDIVPAVIYGQGEPEHIQLERGPLRRVLRIASTSRLIDIQLGKQKRTVLTREIQQHVTRGDLIHVDFFEVDMEGTVTSDVNLVGINSASSELEGIGVATMPLQSVQIEASPADLISEIEVDMSQIDSVDSVVFVRDLVPPEGVTILTDPDTVVARFEIARTEEEEEAEMDADVDVEVPVVGEEEEEASEEDAL